MTEFRLKNLLRLRGLQEQEAAGDLATANHSLTRVIERRATIRAQLAGTSTDLSGPGAIAALSSTRAAAQSMLADLAAMHRAAELLVTDASAAYRKARTETLSLEKLSERHEHQQAQERAAQEQAALDEISLSRRPRRPGALA